MSLQDRRDADQGNGAYPLLGSILSRCCGQLSRTESVYAVAARARPESRLVVIRHITKFTLQPTDIGRFKSGQGRDGLTFGFGGVVDVLGKDHAKTTAILGSCVSRLKRSLQGCCVV